MMAQDVSWELVRGTRAGLISGMAGWEDAEELLSGERAI